MICSFDAHPRRQLDLSCAHEDKSCTYNGVPLCRSCFDNANKQSKLNYIAERKEQEACPNCQAANRREAERTQRGYTIDPSRRYGEHIPLLCFNHQGVPNMAWSTKNINEGRSIFFNGHGHITECDCPGYLLFSPGRFIYKLCYLLGSDNINEG